MVLLIEHGMEVRKMTTPVFSVADDRGLTLSNGHKTDFEATSNTDSDDTADFLTGGDHDGDATGMSVTRRMDEGVIHAMITTV